MAFLSNRRMEIQLSIALNESSLRIFACCHGLGISLNEQGAGGREFADSILWGLLPNTHCSGRCFRVWLVHFVVGLFKFLMSFELCTYCTIHICNLDEKQL